MRIERCCEFMVAVTSGVRVTGLVMGVTLMSCSGMTLAKEAPPTPDVVGFKPILTAPALPVGTIASGGATEPVSDHAKVGVPLTLANMGIDWAAYIATNFHDEDGDAEAGTTYEWLIDGVVVGTAATFTPQIAHGGQWLSVRLKPKTNTGDPDIGDAVTSNAIIVRSKIVDRFTTPLKNITRTWSEANTYCNGLGGGYRLPTIGELNQLYGEMTRSVTTGKNYDLCGRYGWNLSGRCNGYSDFYWSSTPSGGTRWISDMTSGVNHGSAGLTQKLSVTCIQDITPSQLPTAVTLSHTTSGSADLNGPDFAGRPVVTIDKITANLSFVPNTETDLANYRFEWFAGGVSTGVVKDGDNTFTPRVEDQGKKIKVVVTLKP